VHDRSEKLLVNKLTFSDTFAFAVASLIATTIAAVEGTPIVTAFRHAHPHTIVTFQVAIMTLTVMFAVCIQAVSSVLEVTLELASISGCIAS
jgi:hypothetical protein